MQAHIKQTNYAIFILLSFTCYVNGLRSNCSQVPSCATALDVLDKVPDPIDCKNYYICVESSETGNLDSLIGPETCPSGEYFDPNLTECVTGTDCEAECPITPDNCSEADPCTDDTVEAYPNFEDYDCSSYFICGVQNNPVKVYCEAPELYFDGFGCTANPELCCTTIRCNPYCSPTSSNTYTSDPCDCQSYFLCDSEFPTTQLTCPDGSIFIPDYNGYPPCNATTTECTPLCSAFECGATTTTTEPTTTVQSTTLTTKPTTTDTFSTSPFETTQFP